MVLKDFIDGDYTILNGEITDVSLKLVNDVGLVFTLLIQGDGWGCKYGEVVFDFNTNIPMFIGNLLATVGADDLMEIKNKTVRVAVKDVNAPVEYIGNIIYDSWFNYTQYITPPSDNSVSKEEENNEDEVEIEETKEDVTNNEE